MWKLDSKLLLAFLFYLFVNGGAIVGGLLGFIDSIWQIGKNWKIESLKVGSILCFLAGISYPLFLLILYLPRLPLLFVDYFESFLDIFYISIPMLILFIGGITSIIEWQLELRKNKYAQE